jgi:predicted double-glycine peptidase
MLGPFVILAALAAGAALGLRLASRGVTAQNGLVGRQGLAYAILSGAILLVLFLVYAPRLRWMPDVVVLYGQASALHLARAACAFALALLVMLEWPGRGDPARRRALLTGGLLLAAVAVYLGWRSLPLRMRAEDSFIDDGIVRQTTAFTCAPASIATLVRWFGGDSAATEASVASLAGTTHEGTSTLDEIAVMQRLGLAPRYARWLTPDSLLAAGHPALLHVHEPLPSGATIQHAVALLAVDARARAVLLGNPLRGRQVRRFADLRGYWDGEGVLVTSAAFRRSN